ncbi:hypothetical protein SAMN04487866_1099 [Thermoactinomyces sp. DSM 45891]|uniref:hypothetical protein n=1 Tax=Thermoactinomyces sp. DSM 45891 TaxID=1761907 RepID=UPI0009135DF8|nr:hypothetical protein [Thermoactinomyces sp. DSM 45891]SFX47547.1 hypothetical protein SAMN04487866_1099 [Thermoactinomyces sp. DSM 45891]
MEHEVVLTIMETEKYIFRNFSDDIPPHTPQIDWTSKNEKWNVVMQENEHYEMCGVVFHNKSGREVEYIFYPDTGVVQFYNHSYYHFKVPHYIKAEMKRMHKALLTFMNLEKNI